ncbi:MAG: T9SS type A sorting domain-containing protein [Saprospiraceae bacterium]|nr:T9SS type A sorting domain-containing protein [Saprospiraceae bacterium]
MKKNVLLFLMLMSSIHIYSQTMVARINSPASLAGTKEFAGADFGAELSSKLWTAEAVLAEPLLACSTITNPSSLAGKIAVIERGICYFDEKALMAQQAGAIGLIILNHGDLTNLGGLPYTLFVAYPNIASQVTIPCIMLGYDDNLALKAAFAAGETVNFSMGTVPAVDNDLAIFDWVFQSYTEKYVFNPQWGTTPKGMSLVNGQFLFQPGAFFTNKGTVNIDNVNVNARITRAGVTIFNNTTTDNLTIEPDSVRGLINDPFDLADAPFGTKVGTYNLRYNVANDKPDPLTFNNSYNSYFNITENILAKSRFNVTTKSPLVSQYWGGGTDFRALMNPFQITCGIGTTFDSIFTSVASLEPIADMFVEGRVYKAIDINGDNDLTSDELELVAVGSYVFPGTFTATAGNVRIKLDALVGDPSLPYTVDSDDALYFMSVEYPGGSNTFYNAYDVDLSQRQYFNYKNNLQQLSFTDYPYISSRALDGSTGNPDLTNAGLFYIDSNGDGDAQDEEVAYFSPSTALEMNNYNPTALCLEGVGVEDISDLLDLALELSPNPTKEQLKVRFTLPKNSAVQYQIIGMNGQVVLEKSEKLISREFNSSINVAHLSAGNYVLKILTEVGYIKKAFVKMN